MNELKIRKMKRKINSCYKTSPVKFVGKDGDFELTQILFFH